MAVVVQNIAKKAGRNIGKVTWRKRIFLCDWEMTLVRPGKPVPPDTVVFRVPLVMTKFDIKNYLRKIYNIEVHKVNTAIMPGKRKKYTYIRGLYEKQPDYKKAYVTLANDNTFQFPDIFPPRKKRENNDSEVD